VRVLEAVGVPWIQRSIQSRSNGAPVAAGDKFVVETHAGREDDRPGNCTP